MILFSCAEKCPNTKLPDIYNPTSPFNITGSKSIAKNIEYKIKAIIDSSVDPVLLAMQNCFRFDNADTDHREGVT